MDYYMNAAGISVPCIREYEIETAQDMKKGTVVTLFGGKVKKAAEGDMVLGILDEDYKVEKSELCPRAGSGRVKVSLACGMICTCDPFEFIIAAEGTESVINTDGIDMPSEANALAGGYVVLVKKAENSENRDHVGFARRIEASSGTKLTVAVGGKSCAGDVYRIIPPAGFSFLALSEDAKTVVISATNGNTAKVVSVLPENRASEITFTNTFFN